MFITSSLPLYGVEPLPPAILNPNPLSSRCSVVAIVYKQRIQQHLIKSCCYRKFTPTLSRSDQELTMHLPDRQLLFFFCDSTVWEDRMGSVLVYHRSGFPSDCQLEHWPSFHCKLLGVANGLCPSQCDSVLHIFATRNSLLVNAMTETWMFMR